MVGAPPKKIISDQNNWGDLSKKLNLRDLNLRGAYEDSW